MASKKLKALRTKYDESLKALQQASQAEYERMYGEKMRAHVGRCFKFDPYLPGTNDKEAFIITKVDGAAATGPSIAQWHADETWGTASVKSHTAYFDEGRLPPKYVEITRGEFDAFFHANTLAKIPPAKKPW